MVLFSRSFVRKRVISMATTASVAASSLALAKDPTTTHHLREARSFHYVADSSDHAEEQPFLSENNAAMKKMMADMMIKPNGDVDREFVEMMVPHHQGAVDMAHAELKYGHNEQLRRLAQQIVATQQHEIAVMRHALGDRASPPIAFPMQPQAGAASVSQQNAAPHSADTDDALSHHSTN